MKELLKKWKRMSLLTKLLIGMLAGVLIGAIFGESAQSIKPFGTIFLNLLQMIALPLIICSLVTGIAGVSDTKTFGRCGVKILSYYFLTTLFAGAIGLIVAAIIRPGVGFTLSQSYDGAIGEIPSMLDAIAAMFPSNIFASLTNGSYDHALVFSILMGIGILFLPKEQGEKVYKFFELGLAALGSMLDIVLLYAPIGVGVLVADCVGRYGLQFFTFAAKFLAVNYVSVAAMVVVYTTLVWIFARKTPLLFLKKSMPAILTAIGTQSSAAVLPINLQCAEALGAKKSVYGFTIPLGNQINKDGTAILLTASFLFAAQAVGTPIEFGTLVQVVFLSLLLTAGSNSVAGGAVVTITIVINTFGLPMETVTIVAGALALIDGVLTMCNTFGDLAGTIIVSASEERREGKCMQKGA